jgi:2-hydroxychromene-2-carboxylate isomerase
MAICEFVFDVGSPYTYLASTQLRGLEQRSGCQLQLTPVLIGGFKKALGGSMMPSAPQLFHMQKDLQRWARRYGIRLEFPASFPAKTVLAQRAIIAAGDGARAAMHALFDIYWSQGRDVEDPEVVKAALAQAGLDAAAIVAAAEQQPVKDQLRKNTEDALDRGAFGSPTFFVGDEMFWGNDRLDFVEAALREQR